jgi:hypothetical protein
MVFIYGGSFDEGDNEGPFEMYDGTYIASTRSVIVVTINYRLGAFGFLVTDKVRGNMGLMDQTLALHWIQDNIHVFGGDKTQVTIWGESAGAMSVGTHILSPASKGLFSRAIMESHVSILYNNKFAGGLYGQDFCKLLNCTTSHNSECDTACMQKADPHVVISAWGKAAANAVIYIEANWGHIADGLLSFIPTCCDDYVRVRVCVCACVLVCAWNLCLMCMLTFYSRFAFSHDAFSPHDIPLTHARRWWRRRWTRLIAAWAAPCLC